MHHLKRTLMTGALALCLAAGTPASGFVLAAKAPAASSNTGLTASREETGLAGLSSAAVTFAGKKTVKKTVSKKKSKKSQRKLKSWLGVCSSVGKTLNKKRFRYSFSNASFSYRKALRRKTANCSTYVSYCMQKYGILKDGQAFYVNHNKIRKQHFSHWNTSKVTILKVMKPCSRTRLKPGDIVCWAGLPHSCIYAGLDEEGRKTWYDAGRQSTYKGRIGSYFREIKPTAYQILDENKIAYIIRLKGL